MDNNEAGGGDVLQPLLGDDDAQLVAAVVLLRNPDDLVLLSAFNVGKLFFLPLAFRQNKLERLHTENFFSKSVSWGS